MKAGANVDTRLREVVRNAVPEAIAAYVFGSVAAGVAGAASDVDVAVLCRAALDSVARFNAQEAIARDLGVDVDLVDLCSASTVMRMQVITKGRLLFSTDEPERGRFEDFIFSSYARLNEERAAILEQVRDEGTVYGG